MNSQFELHKNSSNYDAHGKVHTTPQGSERIVKVIYPYLKKILEKLDR